MSLPQETIKVLRYLICMRVHSSIVRLTDNFSVDVAYVIGSLIADKLPTRFARRWKRNLDYYNSTKREDQLISNLWPIESAIVPYPSKCTYSEGELIYWELKLFGEDACHEFFLESILPALEDGGARRNKRDGQVNGLWGSYDLDSVFVCDGSVWKPLVEEGVIDLNYIPTPWQWFNYDDKKIKKEIETCNYKDIVWLNGFSLNEDINKTTIHDDQYRSLHVLISAVVERMNSLLEVNNRTHLSIWDFLESDQKDHLAEAMEQSEVIKHGFHDLSPVPAKLPGRWKGAQHFSDKIPELFIPYLNLASILHVGEHINFGAGTFLMRNFSAQLPN